MLKSSVVTNTWECDNCETEFVDEVNPLYRITVYAVSMPVIEPCEVDFCAVCIQLVPTQVVADYVDAVNAF